MTVTPSLEVGTRVIYTDEGIVSMIRGVVQGFRFNNLNERIEYFVKWDTEVQTDQHLYSRYRLRIQ